MRVADLSALPLPTGLVDSVEQIIDRALGRRPDLASRLARCAPVKRNSGGRKRNSGQRFYMSGSVDRRRAGKARGRRSATFTMNETEYGAFLNFEWKLFDGFERNNALRKASLCANAEADWPPLS